MKKKKSLFMLIFATVLFGVAVLFFTVSTINAVQTVNSKAVNLAISDETSPLIIIDAGHGGEDGGATANSIVEKELNLAIADKLNTLFRQTGFNTLMTREEDTSLSSEGLDTLKERKTSDIKKRLELVESNPNCIFISIHQNKFSQSDCSGTQVFYSTNNPESQKLAECIKSSVVERLQPNNNRETKPAGSNIYILDKTKEIAVLVECGFISNKEESEKLQNDDYQNQLSFAIYNGTLNYLSNKQSNL